MINNISPQEKPLALVVDDDLTLRLSMYAALAKAGYSTVEAKNGHSALEIFQSVAPDIVLLDVVMPEMDGFVTCTALRNLPEGKYTQILMVTGLDDTESIERAFEVGANDFIAKPINLVMLGHRGKYMLRAGRSIEEFNKSRLRYEISKAMRNGKLFALLFLDLDQFKRINDTFGHHLGDLLLKNVSETLKQCIRKSYTVTGPAALGNSDTLIARLGGDEFIILLADIQQPENAAIVARKIIQALSETYSLDGHEISVTSSIGISVFPTDGEDIEILLKSADSAMYHAKEKERYV